MALLVPEATLFTRIGLVGALTDHYGLPGCLADFRCQLKKTVWQDGEDPSKFVVALAVKAFVDMGLNARTRLFRNRFIAGHPNCALRRHLDSVPPETPIRDIVDRCRVWDSHADTDDQRVVKPMPEKRTGAQDPRTGGHSCTHRVRRC